MRQRAFTLIELLVYVGVLVVVLGAIFFFMVNIIANEQSIGDRVRMMDEADFAMRQVLDQARGAKYIYPTPTTVFVAGGSGGQLILEKTNATVNFYVSAGVFTMTDSAVPGYIRALTSPRVAVDTFALVCMGIASPCESDPKGVRITLGLRDVVTNQTITITTSATPRGY